MLKDPILQKLAEAVATQEGFYVKGERPQRNHNPGDLRAEGIEWEGQTGTDAAGFCVFEDDAAGWRALRVDLQHHSIRYPNQTLTQFIKGDGNGWTGYAPASDHNSPLQYACFIAERIGADRENTFAQLSAQKGEA